MTGQGYWVSFLERVWTETRNPLAVWEAIDRCLNSKPPMAIPQWCLQYLAKAASGLTDLAWGRGPGGERLAPDGREALKATPIALGLGGRRGKKNAFRAYAEDEAAMRDASEGLSGRSYRVSKGEVRAHKVGIDRSRRLKRRAERVLG